MTIFRIFMPVARRSAVAAAFLLALAVPAAHAVTLKIASLAPEGTVWMDKMRAGADTIAQRTQGRVKFKFYPGGVMGTDQSVLRKIRIGQLHGGALTVGSLAEVYPDLQIYGLPLLFRNRDELDAVRARFDGRLIKGLRAQGFVSFGLADGGFAYFMSQAPIRSVDDLRSQRVWLPEGDTFDQTWFASAGVVPVTLPLTDVLTGLQTGLISAVATSPIGAIAFQWHAKVKYVTDTPLIYLYGTLVLSAKAYDKIKPDDQAIVSNVMRQIHQELDAANSQDNRHALEALREQGLEFVMPTETGLAELEATARKARDTLRRDHVVSADLLDSIESLLSSLRQGAEATP